MKRHPAAEGPAIGRICELEDALAAEFRKHEPGQPLDSRLMSAARRWSHAVWQAAEERRPASLNAEDLRDGLALAQRPVFICGVQRSGTTLLRDLLDGHPQLVVIPTEAAFYAGLEPALFGSPPQCHRAYLGCRWLERLALPPPRWLLGRSSAASSPYVAFAGDIAAWMMVSEHRHEAKTPSWPLCALALAYAQHRGSRRIPPEAQRWVEKTPTSERFLARIWHEFPAARVIHVVRRPQSALASYAALNRHAWGPRGAAGHCLRNMAPSYRIARRAASRFSPERYLLIRYEDLVADRARVMARVAGFLDIEALPMLHQPTVAGRPASNNSSFAEPGSPRNLNRFERTLLRLTVTRNARSLGYR